MKLLKRLMIAFAAVLALAAVGGVAVANTSHNAPAKATGEAESTSDTDNIQEEVGDQTSPDTGEAESKEGGSESESAAESDGPGGHEDPPGNVEHEFEGAE